MSAGGDRHEDGPFGPLHRGGWGRPSSRARERVRRMPSEELLGPVAPEAMESIAPDDVRAANDALAAGEEIVVTCSHAQADLTVSIRPPDADGAWRVSGRAWLVERPGAPLVLALVHDDHVLSTIEVADGEYFELEEILPKGWHLEVHLAGGACLRVEDPRS